MKLITILLLQMKLINQLIIYKKNKKHNKFKIIIINNIKINLLNIYNITIKINQVYYNKSV